MEIKDLDREIKSGNIRNLYFFYGEEQFLMENKIKSIKNRILDPSFADLNYVCLEEKKLSISRVQDELLSLPAMSDAKMIVIKNSGLFGNAKLTAYKELCELLEDIPEYLYVIFTERDFDKKKEKNLDPVRKAGEVVKFDYLPPVQLERWLDKYFSDNKKSIIPRDINIMISRCGQNMATLYNEANKLINYVGDRTKITLEDVETLVPKSTETQLFDLIDRIAAGKGEAVFEEIQQLIQSRGGEDPSTILTLLSARMGELLTVKQLSMDGIKPDSMVSSFEPRKPAFVIKKLLDQSKSFTEARLVQFLRLGIDYTAQIRSGTLPPRTALEMYVAELTNK